MSLDPFGWAALFRYIDVAVTERFHDSVFALRNNKPVIAIDWSPERFASDGSSKTNCLLTSYSLDDMHFTYRSKDDRKKMYAFIDSKRDKEISQITSSINDSIAQTYQNLMIRISRELDF